MVDITKDIKLLTPNHSLKDTIPNHKYAGKENIPASFRGSMSLEASLVIPIFIFFLMTIMLGIEMVRLQSNVFESLHQVESVSFSEGSDARSSSVFNEYMEGREYPYICVREGKSGIKLNNLSSIASDGRINYKVHYSFIPFVRWMPIDLEPVEDGVFGHSFTGYKGPLFLVEDTDKEEFVYISSTGSKYHKDSGCSYLIIRPQSVEYADLVTIRNNSRAKYYPCEVCRPKSGGMVFITSYGNRYHGKSDCSELKRTIKMISLKEATECGYSACSKCG